MSVCVCLYVANYACVYLCPMDKISSCRMAAYLGVGSIWLQNFCVHWLHKKTSPLFTRCRTKKKRSVCEKKSAFCPGGGKALFSQTDLFFPKNSVCIIIAEWAQTRRVPAGTKVRSLSRNFVYINFNGAVRFPG